MSGDFQEHLSEDRRLVILRLLRESGGTANESNLHVGVQQLGHRTGVTRGIVRDDIEWLRQRGLVTVEWFSESVAVAKLTERGLDVAEGNVAVEGVKKPRIV